MTCRIPKDKELHENLKDKKKELKQAYKKLQEEHDKLKETVKQGSEELDKAGYKLSQSDLKKYQLKQDNPKIQEVLLKAEQTNHERSLNKVSEAIKIDIEDGVNEISRLSATADTGLEWIVHKALFWNKGVGEKLKNSGLESATWMANRLWGIPQGLGGNMRHIFTAGEHQGLALTRFQAHFSINYRQILWDHGKRTGQGFWKNLQMTERNAEKNPELDRLYKDVYEDLNNARLGRARSKNKTVQELSKLVSEHNQMLFDELAAEGLEKGTIEPHHFELKFKKEQTNKHSERKLKALFRKGYESTYTPEESKVLADKLYEMLDSYKDHSYRNTFQSRYDLLRNIDTSAEYDGVKILDLMDTDIRTTIDVAQRNAAGWIGISKATNGAIKSESDISAMYELFEQEGLEKGVETDYLRKVNEDNMNRLFGRPVRGGIPPELRNIMNLGTLTGMGKAGISQAVDSGQASIRALFHGTDINFVRKVLQEVGRESEEAGLVKDIHALTGLWQGISELSNHARFLDIQKLEEIGEIRKLSRRVSNMATANDMKAELLRGLGKVNMQDAVQKYQSRVLMSSYLLDVGKHFHNGTGKMSVERMMENGITDRFGKDVDLEAGFKHSEFDENGLLIDLNLDKWSKKAKSKLALGMWRAEATEVQRTVVGDLPTWVNPVAWQCVTQFREFSINGTNKQLLRQIKHADIESVTSVAINTAMAGLVKTAQYKVAVAGANAVGGREILGEAEKQHSYYRDILKYTMNTGISMDVYDLADALGNIGHEASNGQYGAAWNTGRHLFNQVPTGKVLDNYWKVAGYGATGEFPEMMSKAKELIAYSNSIYADALSSWMLENGYMKRVK